MRLIKKFTSMARTEQILIMVSCLVLVGLSIFIFTYGNTWLNSDSAAAVTLANEQIKHNDIFPDAWHGSTGVPIFNFPIILFLQFTSDFLLAKDLAQLFFVLLLVGSVVFLSKTVFQNNCWMLLIPMLFSYISNTQYEMLFIQCAYTANVFLMLYVISFYFNSVNQGLHIQKRSSVVLFLLALFLSCLLGIMTIQQITIPFIGALVVLYIVDHANDARLELQSFKKHIILCVIVFLISIAGLVASQIIIKQLNIGGNPGLMRFAPTFPEITDNITITFQGFINYIGINLDVSLFSFTGVQNVLKIIFMVAFTIIFPVLACLNLQTVSYPRKFFIVFSLIHSFEVLVILIFTIGSDYIGCARYMLTCVILLNIISCGYVYDKYIKREKLIGFIFTVLISVFAIILSIPTFNTIGYQNAISNMKGITNFLKENQLDYGYASFWYAGKNTVLSNGEVQINAVNIFQDHIEKYLWLSSEEWYEPKAHDGNTFLMLNQDELQVFAPNGYEKTWFGTPEKVLNYDEFTILVFDYNISINDFGGVLDSDLDLPSHMICSDISMRLKNGTVHISEGQVLYGPYIDLEPGQYLFTIDIESQDAVTIQVTSEAGAQSLGSYELTREHNSFSLSVEKPMKQVEFPIYGSSGGSVIIDAIQLERQT